jgi:hypothetical protein
MLQASFGAIANFDWFLVNVFDFGQASSPSGV